MENKLKKYKNKNKCFETAQAVAQALELCDTKKDVKHMLDEMGFTRVELTTSIKNGAIEITRSEYQADYKDKAQAVYINPFYGVVKVVDYVDMYTDGTALLSEHATRKLLDYDYDNLSGHGIKINI